MEPEIDYDALCRYKMTLKESNIWKTLKKEILEICDELKIPQRVSDLKTMREIPRLKDTFDYYIKYKEGFGFYEVIDDRGYRFISDSHHKDREKFRIYLLEKEINNAGQTIEVKLRDILKEKWNANKYHTDYDSRKYWFEYTIVAFKKIDNEKYNDLISEYTKLMNRWFTDTHWEYIENQFVETSENKEIE